MVEATEVEKPKKSVRSKAESEKAEEGEAVQAALTPERKLLIRAALQEAFEDKEFVQELFHDLVFKVFVMGQGTFLNLRVFETQPYVKDMHYDNMAPEESKVEETADAV